MYAAIAAFALSATAAYSQSLPLPTSGGEAEQVATQGLQQLSGECRNAILSLATSPLAQCLNVAALAPAISANTSIVPVLDNWMTEICSSEPCDQDELDSAASNFSTACASDFEQYNVDAEDIEGIAGLYPLVRELVCLKTTEPFSNSTADNSTETTNSTSSNSTEESAFCVTSLLTELGSYINSDLTVNSIFGLVLGPNDFGRQALAQIPPEALCQDCIYSAAGLIEQQYPGIWSQPLVNGNFTVGGYLNETCSNETFPVIDEANNTITLPDSVFPAAENSTYAYGITYFNGTYEPSEDVQQPPALPFANAPAAPIANGTETEEPATSTTASSAPSATAAEGTSAVAVDSESASAAVSSASGAVPSGPVQQRDVTAAKRRWIGQQ